MTNPQPQDWSLICCVIEIVVETITIIIYAIVFYRFYSKRNLHKSMDLRDKARSDLYLAQLRTQSAPNTPGFTPHTPYTPGYAPKSPAFPSQYAVQNPDSAAEMGEYFTPQYAQKPASQPREVKPFQLQAPPIRVQGATPKAAQEGFERSSSPPMPLPSPGLHRERMNEHVAAAPGEQTYDAVPIPGAYASPLGSPAAPGARMQFASMPGMAQ